MKKSRIRITPFLGIAILAGGISLATTSGCTVNDIVQAIETMQPNDGETNKNIVGRPLDPIVGEPNEERIFEVGEHKFYMFDDYLTEETMDAYNKAIKMSSDWPEYYKLYIYMTFDDIGTHKKMWLENTVPVKVVADENGEFTTYGEPVLEEELAPVKTK